MSKATITTLITFYNEAAARAAVTQRGGLTFTPEDKREIVRLAESLGVGPGEFSRKIVGTSYGATNTEYVRHYLRLKTFTEQVQRERRNGGAVSQAPAAKQRKVTTSPRLTISLNAQIEEEIKKRRDAQQGIGVKISDMEKIIRKLNDDYDSISSEIMDLQAAATILSK